jgi:hypothetical protein
MANPKRSNKEIYVLSYQDWHIHYFVDEIKKKINVLEIIYSDRKKQ